MMDKSKQKCERANDRLGQIEREMRAHWAARLAEASALVRAAENLDLSLDEIFSPDGCGLSKVNYK